MKEYDLYSILIEELNKKYRIQEEEEFLFKYLAIKTAIVKDRKKVRDLEIFKMILEELNLPVINESYLEVNIGLEENIKSEIIETSISFMDNFRFRASFYGDLNHEEELEEVFRKGYQRAYKYRKLDAHSDYKKKYRLKVLNELFGVSPTPNDYEIKPFVYPENHDFFKRTIEEYYTSLTEASKHGTSNTTAHISEKQLEDYLIENLELIEEGLEFIENQVQVQNGFIDILAKDKDGIYCVIELKINEDRSIMWQAIHYPKEIRKMKKVSKVRMITVANDYSKALETSLKMTPGIELLKYDLKVKNSEIEDITLTKV